MTTAKPTATVTVTGHRIRKDIIKKDEELRLEIADFAEAFAEELATELGEEVHKMISSGEWWRSRSPRFARYRSWIRLNYGSDRRRKTGGKRRRADDPHSRVDMEQTDMDDWGNVQHRMTQWLINKLRTATVKTNSRSGPRYYVTGLRTGSGAIDVTQALEYLEKASGKAAASKGYTRRDGTQVSAKQERMQRLEEIITASGSANLMKLKTTRYGQRLWRMAEIEATREIRQRNADKSQDGGRRYKKKNVAGTYIWGVQTGRLAKSWLEASSVVKSNVWKHRINIYPSSDDLIHGGQYSLTYLLLRKQGGMKPLLSPGRIKRVIGKALKTATGEGLAARLKK